MAFEIKVMKPRDIDASKLLCTTGSIVSFNYYVKHIYYYYYIKIQEID